MNRIIIFKEKHGDRYFDASTPELLHKACLKIFKERLAEGWYEGYAYPELQKPTMTIQESLTHDKKIQAVVEDQWREYNNVLRGINKQAQEKAYIEKVVAEDSGEKAHKFLNHRSHYEYESYEIENLESTEVEPDEPYKETEYDDEYVRDGEEKD
jgi:hypothetical protein